MVFRQEMNADKEDRTTTSPCATQDRYPLPKRTVLVEVRRGHPAKAFDAVLVQELHEVIQKAKRMADEIQKASDLWDLGTSSDQRRKEIDRKYDSRDSRVTDVLRRLLYEIYSVRKICAECGKRR